VVGINDYTMVCHNLNEPFLSCVFIDPERVFVALFYNFKHTHYHFTYNMTERRLEGEVSSITFEGQTLNNYVIQAFFSEDTDELYVFYREGQAITMPRKDTKAFRQEMLAQNLGQMELVYGQALVVVVASEIFFFRQKLDDVKGIQQWKEYFKIDNGGACCYTPGNVRI